MADSGFGDYTYVLDKKRLWCPNTKEGSSGIETSEHLTEYELCSSQALLRGGTFLTLWHYNMLKLCCQSQTGYYYNVTASSSSGPLGLLGELVRCGGRHASPLVYARCHSRLCTCCSCLLIVWPGLHSHPCVSSDGRLLANASVYNLFAKDTTFSSSSQPASCDSSNTD